MYATCQVLHFSRPTFMRIPTSLKRKESTTRSRQVQLPYYSYYGPLWSDPSQARMVEARTGNRCLIEAYNLPARESRWSLLRPRPQVILSRYSRDLMNSSTLSPSPVSPLHAGLGRRNPLPSREYVMSPILPTGLKRAGSMVPFSVSISFRTCTYLTRPSIRVVVAFPVTGCTMLVI